MSSKRRNRISGQYSARLIEMLEITCLSDTFPHSSHGDSSH